MAPAPANPRRLLLIDAFEWSNAYPPSPLRDVAAWYTRQLPGVLWKRVEAQDDCAAAVRSGADAVVMSGSPRNAWAEDPVTQRLSEAILECQARRIPFLGVCFGHQLLGRALGAEVRPHPSGWELGNTPMELTRAGRQFPLFAGFPEQFQMLQSHLDEVSGLPPGCELLARGSFTRVQSFHWNGLLMGVQFHPEFDPETLRFLWSIRREKWRPQLSFNLDQTLDQAQPTPLGRLLFENFVRHCVP